MEFYWVNIGMSLEEVKQNKFLWAPLCSKKPRDPKNLNKGFRTTHLSHWDVVADVKKGDVIFCNYNRTLLFVAIAISDAYQAERPKSRAFDAWHDQGNQVKVKLIELTPPLSIDGYICELFSKRYNDSSTIKVIREGDGVFQGYMAGIPQGAGIELLRLSGDTEEIIVEESENADSKKRKSKIDGTTRKILSEARIGQGQFRQDLIKKWKKCAISGITNFSLLIASHILPWSKSDDSQRLDPYNGFLLAVHIDRLFDQGLISFDDGGKIIISSHLSPTDATVMGIHSALSLPLDARHKPYLAKHRELFKL
jgi:putative restriction endonuclease